MQLIINNEKYRLNESPDKIIHGLKKWMHEPWQTDILHTLEEWYGPADCMSIKTSGSTGQPKLISHSKKSMRRSAEKTLAYFRITQGQKAILCLPAQYIAGKMMIIRAIVGDLDLVVVPPSANPLKSHTTPVDFAAMTPYQLESILSEEPHKIGLIRCLLIGGAPVSDSLAEVISRHHQSCYLGYGMTETITHVAVRKLNGSDKDKMYHALPGIHFQTDEADRLIIHSDHLDCESVITNDLVRLLTPHQFEWIGRQDDIINSGGIKIFPEQVEAKVRSLIKQRFFVAGIPDHKLGSRVALFIEGKEALPEELKVLKDSIRKVTDRYEMPKIIYFVHSFKETPTGKIKKDPKIYGL